MRRKAPTFRRSTPQPSKRHVATSDYGLSPFSTRPRRSPGPTFALPIKLVRPRLFLMPPRRGSSCIDNFERSQIVTMGQSRKGSANQTLFCSQITGALFSSLEPMTVSDPAFRAFIVRHVDATVPAERLRRIAAKCGHTMPGTLKNFCREIQAAADK